MSGEVRCPLFDGARRTPGDPLHGIVDGGGCVDMPLPGLEKQICWGIGTDRGARFIERKFFIVQRPAKCLTDELYLLDMGLSFMA